MHKADENLSDRTRFGPSGQEIVPLRTFSLLMDLYIGGNSGQEINSRGREAGNFLIFAVEEIFYFDKKPGLPNTQRAAE